MLIVSKGTAVLYTDGFTQITAINLQSKKSF